MGRSFRHDPIVHFTERSRLVAVAKFPHFAAFVDSCMHHGFDPKKKPSNIRIGTANLPDTFKMWYKAQRAAWEEGLPPVKGDVVSENIPFPCSACCPQSRI